MTTMKTSTWSARHGRWARLSKHVMINCIRVYSTASLRRPNSVASLARRPWTRRKMRTVHTTSAIMHPTDVTLKTER